MTATATAPIVDTIPLLANDTTAATTLAANPTQTEADADR